MGNKTVAITRPSTDKDTLTGLLQDRGYHVIHEPLTNILLRTSAQHELEQALSQEPSAIILTSRYGVKALSALTPHRDIALLCVGPATGRAALASGFDRVFTAGGDVNHLLEHILGAYDDEAHFLYLSADQVRLNLATALAKQGMHVDRLVVYDTVAAEQFSDTFAEHMKRGQIDAVTFLSQRAAQVFEALAVKAGIEDSLKTMHACTLSKPIASVLHSSQWKRIHAAGPPTLGALSDVIDKALATRKKA